MPEAIAGNRNVEDAAVRFVIESERRAGRTARDTRGQGALADVESDGRVIEVKAIGTWLRQSGFLMLEERQVAAGLEREDFYLYIVENIAQGDPARFELRIAHGETLRRLLARAKLRRYFEVPMTKGDYVALPAQLSQEVR